MKPQSDSATERLDARARRKVSEADHLSQIDENAAALTLRGIDRRSIRAFTARRKAAIVR